jgi:hypothetical protein
MTRSYPCHELQSEYRNLIRAYIPDDITGRTGTVITVETSVNNRPAYSSPMNR